MLSDSPEQASARKSGSYSKLGKVTMEQYSPNLSANQKVASSRMVDSPILAPIEIANPVCC